MPQLPPSQIAGDMLASGRKGVALAAASLMSTLMQAHGASPLMQPWMAASALAALDRGESYAGRRPVTVRLERLASSSTLCFLLFCLAATRRAGLQDNKP